MQAHQETHTHVQSLIFYAQQQGGERRNRGTVNRVMK